jgi:hypothetical protein
VGSYSLKEILLAPSSGMVRRSYCRSLILFSIASTYYPITIWPIAGMDAQWDPTSQFKIGVDDVVVELEVEGNAVSIEARVLDVKLMKRIDII